MHDCSRNGAMNVPYIKEVLMISALMGLNRFMLYTEDVYEINITRSKLFYYLIFCDELCFNNDRWI